MVDWTFTDGDFIKTKENIKQEPHDSLLCPIQKKKKEKREKNKKIKETRQCNIKLFYGISEGSFS